MASTARTTKVFQMHPKMVIRLQQDMKKEKKNQHIARYSFPAIFGPLEGLHDGELERVVAHGHLLHGGGLLFVTMNQNLK